MDEAFEEMLGDLPEDVQFQISMCLSGNLLRQLSKRHNSEYTRSLKTFSMLVSHCSKVDMPALERMLRRMLALTKLSIYDAYNHNTGIDDIPPLSLSSRP